MSAAEVMPPAGNLGALERELARTVDPTARARLRKAIAAEREQGEIREAYAQLADEREAAEEQAERARRGEALRARLKEVNATIDCEVAGHLEAWRVVCEAERRIKGAREERARILHALAQLSGREAVISEQPSDRALNEARDRIRRAGMGEVISGNFTRYTIAEDADDRSAQATRVQTQNLAIGAR